MMNIRRMSLRVMVLSALMLVAGSVQAAIPASSGDIVLGEWNTDLDKCRSYAEQHGIPLMAVWSKVGCHMCDIFDTILPADEFVEWRKKQQMVMCYVKSPSWFDKTAELNWISGSLTAAPFVRIYWVKDGKTKADQRFSGRKSSFPPGDANGLITKLEGILKDWSPAPAYAGGVFLPETEGSRIEAETGTKSVTFMIVRDESVKEVATNNLLKTYTSSAVPWVTKTITWKVGETNQNVTIDIPVDAFRKDGDQMILYMDDNSGNLVSTNHITYLEKKNAASNPKWLGEEFGFGEWTMDIDEAKKKVAAADGKAYTLVSIQGSLWCPDCANTDRNFLEVEDGSGNNRFAAWAKSKNVALVAMDIPNYNGPTVADRATPTLFSADAYATVLARASEYPQSGADASLTNKIVRSGLGYMTRKGITTEQAKAQLEKFHDLAYNNTDKGGFHRPEDGNKNRTGVPIFVLLRKDGTVAARLTRMAAVSPMSADKANFDNYIKRFEEMLAIADDDATEIENNYPGEGSIVFKANGGSANGQLCNADFQDTFKLDGVGGNALQNITVKGSSDAQVKVSFVSPSRLDKAGKLDPYAYATGSLKDGISMDYTFTETGDYYVMVEGLDIKSNEFKLESNVGDNFHAFGILGTVVLVPQEKLAVAKAADSSSTVVIRLEKDMVYRLQGVKTDDAETCDVLKPHTDEESCQYFTALVDGDHAIELFYGKGAGLSYQKWQPGEIGYVSTSTTVKENEAGVQQVTIARTGGKSGKVIGKISVDPSSSDNIKDFDGRDRFVLVGAEDGSVKVNWDDGETSNLVVNVQILNNNDYDGDMKLALKLEVESDNGDVVVTEGKGLFTFNVIEDEKQEPGKAMFSGANPFFSKPKTVYAKESEGAELLLARIEARDGEVSAKLKSSLAGTVIEGKAYADGLVTWANRDDEVKTILVKGVPAGKTAKLTLSQNGTFKVLAASNTISVVSVADNAPEFKESAESLTLYRYVASTNTFQLKETPSDKVTFTKLSGTLPAGLKVGYDAGLNALALAGVPTAKAGTYVAVYQAKDGKVAGLTIEITITIVDPTDSKNSPETANEAVSKSRTFKDIPVISKNRLVGLLQVTIPTKGNVSAKYTCAEGTFSLSAKNWSEFDPSTKDLAADLRNAKGYYPMTILVKNDGGYVITLDDGETEVVLEGDGTLWDKTNSAQKWAGYYTVALVQRAVAAEDREGFAPAGYGYLTLKMDSASAWNAGKVTWAGMLPNGTAVSGASLLFHTDKNDGLEGKLAELPIFKATSTDVLGVVAGICEDAVKKEERRCVNTMPGIDNYWTHAEKDAAAKAGYEILFDVCGGYYLKTDSIAGCCEEYYETTSPWLGFDVSTLIGTTYGTFGDPGTATVSVGEKTMTLAKGAPTGMTLKFDQATGLVSGKVRLPYGESGKYVTADWKGVLVVGWGEGCGCGVFDTYLPFVSGSYYFSDKVFYTKEESTAQKSLTVKRGGLAKVDVTVGAPE